MDVILALTLALAQEASPEAIDRWIVELGADRAEDRDAAHRRLREAGAAALPALRKVLGASRDPEVLVRCRKLVDEIADEGELGPLMAVPVVSLRSDACTLAEAVAALEASGQAVKASLKDDARTFAVSWDRTPLLRALDELCRAHGKITWTADAAGTVTIGRGETSKCPPAYAGPVRVEVARINETRGTDFAEQATSEITVELKLSGLRAEETSWRAVLKLAEARLEDGTALKEGPAAAGQRIGVGALAAGGIVIDAGGMIRLVGDDGGGRSFTFNGVPRAAARLAEIRGSVELTVPVGAREVELTSADMGKDVALEDYTLRLVSLSNGKAEISFKDNRAAESSRVASDAVAEYLALMEEQRGFTDPRKAEVARRMSFAEVSGLGGDGASRSLKADWKKPESRQTVRVSRGRNAQNLPTMEVEAPAGTTAIRFRFKSRSAVRVFPFTLKDVPLP
jgi:hypothetical protein